MKKAGSAIKVWDLIKIGLGLQQWSGALLFYYDAHAHGSDEDCRKWSLDSNSPCKIINMVHYSLYLSTVGLLPENNPWNFTHSINQPFNQPKICQAINQSINPYCLIYSHRYHQNSHHSILRTKPYYCILAVIHTPSIISASPFFGLVWVSNLV